MVLLGFAACAPAMPQSADPLSPHRTAEGFINPPGSPVRDVALGDFLAFFARAIGRGGDILVPADHVLPVAEAEAGVARAQAAEGVSVTWIGHATFLIRIGGKNILTDPYMTDRASPVAFGGPKRFVPPGIAIERLPPLDAVIVSHNHYDHLDGRTVERLAPRTAALAVVPLGNGEIFESRGWSRIKEVDWGDAVELGDGVRITALPVIHWSRRTPFDGGRTLWAGYMIEGGGKRLMFCGDTGYGPVFAELGRKYGPFDLAFVPIGSYDPPVIMKAVHTNPEEAVKLGRDIGARALVGMHWGTVRLTEEPPFEPPGRFRKAAAEAGYPEADSWVLKIGETRALR